MRSLNIFGKNTWGVGHTDLSKYLVARLAQLVDEDEVITNRHSATNGLILLEELHDAATYCLERWKTHHRLRNVLQESLDPEIKSSLANDPIVTAHYRSAIDELRRLEKATLDPAVAKEIQRVSLVYLTAIRRSYCGLIREHLERIDLTAGFDKNAALLDGLLNALVPQLLREGHSIGYLQLVARILCREECKWLAARLYHFVLPPEEHQYTCFVPGSLAQELGHLLGTQAAQANADEFRKPRPAANGVKFSVTGKDPFSALIQAAGRAYRRLNLRGVAINPAILDPIWNEAFFLSNGKYDRYDFSGNSDPTVPTVRVNTFRQTLERLEISLDSLADSTVQNLEESLYFYNLAQSAPSVENAFLLLWTALESLMGFKSDKSDIEIIQDNVAPSLALGAVGRRVNAIVQRLRTTGKANGWRYLGVRDSDEYEVRGLCDWAEWLTDTSTKDKPEDPYEVLKEEPLLCRHYRLINERWKKLGDLLPIVRLSEKTIRFQLDRLYMTRNRIVHSGRFSSAGAYQWIHLEWYVGKLLAQAVLSARGMGPPSSVDFRDALFGSFQGQFRASLDYLERHKDKPITGAELFASGLTRFPSCCF